jgi:hypothetical protein
MEPLKPEMQQLLRETHKMLGNEVAYCAGDLIVAINVTTNQRRVLGKVNEIMTENSKRVLKG